MGAPNERQPRAVAVLAFKAVYTLETKRRENDKRVLALYVEYVASNFDRHFRLTNSRMKDMMTVLVQCDSTLSTRTCFPDWPTSRLKDISDPKQIAPDGQTIEGRLQKLCESVADDIKKCANACDTYLK